MNASSVLTLTTTARVGRSGGPGVAGLIRPPDRLVATPQNWLVLQERRRAADALWRIGEPAFFLAMWTRTDFDAGRVDRCPTCLGQTSLADAYDQSTYANCPTCAGAGYAGPHGGVKVCWLRPGVWTWDEEQTTWGVDGTADRQAATVTTLGDVWCNRRDWVVRGDGGRYAVVGVAANHLTTGFATPSHVSSAVTTVLTLEREPFSSTSRFLSPSSDVAVGMDRVWRAPPFSMGEFADGPVEYR